MGFFDNLSKKATETYKNTTEKTNKIAREMKLKSAISDRKTKIQSIYTEIGKKVYEKHIREENIDIKAELANECGQIDVLSKEIEDMNTEMRALKDIRLCKTCAAEIAIEAKFCPRCGAPQENIEIKTEVVVEPAGDTAKQSTIYANTGKEIVENGAQNLAEIPSKEIVKVENNANTEETSVNQENNAKAETEAVVNEENKAETEAVVNEENKAKTEAVVNEENNTETEAVVNEENNNDEETEIVVENCDNQ